MNWECIDKVKIGVIGDFCIDVYWHADMKKSELSRETPHYPLPIVAEKVYLGAAGNVAANIAELHPHSLLVCSVIGNDWRGILLKQELERRNITIDGIFTEQGRFTNAYCKPMVHGISETVYENPRIDFSSDIPISAETEQSILQWLEQTTPHLDILCVCDQFQNGLLTAVIQEKIKELARKGLSVIVDSRYRIEKYQYMMLKPNELECWRAVYQKEDCQNASLEEFTEAAKRLAQNCNSKVMLTLGAKGSVYTDGTQVIVTPAQKIEPPLDICGAGDTFLSAFACMIAARQPPEKAAFVAGCASAVTIKKIGITGTASREEIDKIG